MTTHTSAASPLLTLGTVIVLTVFACLSGSPSSASAKELVQAGPAPASLAGEWWDETSGRCYMKIAAEEDGRLRFEVNWSDSAFANYRWRFSGVWNAAEASLRYEDGDQTLRESRDNWQTVRETVKYEKGQGLVTLKDGKIYWDDHKEQVCKDCRFSRKAAAPDKAADCAEALAPLVGKWEWLERPGARPFLMEITPGTDECRLGVEALWPHSPADHDVWRFTVRWNPAAGTYDYEGGRHFSRIMPMEPDQTREEPRYEDGTGSLRLENGVLLWDERKEGICKECRFTKGN